MCQKVGDKYLEASRLHGRNEAVPGQNEVGNEEEGGANLYPVGLMHHGQIPHNEYQNGVNGNTDGKDSGGDVRNNPGKYHRQQSEAGEQLEIEPDPMR